MELLGKKRRIQIQICVLEIAEGCLGVGLGLPVNHTAHLRSGNFRLTLLAKVLAKEFRKSREGLQGTIWLLQGARENSCPPCTLHRATASSCHPISEKQHLFTAVLIHEGKLSVCFQRSVLKCYYTHPLGQSGILSVLQRRDVF